MKDLALDIGTGEVELYFWDYVIPEIEGAPAFDMAQVELTLKPVGKLIDGSTGSVITSYPIYDGGDRLKGIPVGTYELTAVWKPKGYNPVPLLVTIRNADQLKESITFTFDPNDLGYNITQIQIKVP